MYENGVRSICSYFKDTHRRIYIYYVILLVIFLIIPIFLGLSYFGEYPLAWAACCEDESSYNLLLKHGADPNMQDTFGNSILHVLVIRDKLVSTLTR